MAPTCHDDDGGDGDGDHDDNGGDGVGDVDDTAAADGASHEVITTKTMTVSIRRLERTQRRITMLYDAIIRGH